MGIFEMGSISTGEITGGPKPFGPKDAHAFANALNSYLSRHTPG